MTDVDVNAVSELYATWERELAQLDHEPDPALIASLESQALDMGVDLFDVFTTLTAAFDPSLHPRGKDGKFIEVGGLIRLFNFSIQGKDGKQHDFSGRRGKVLGIDKDPKSDKLPPNIRVGLYDTDDMSGPPKAVVTVKPNHIEKAPEKGRLPNAESYKAPDVKMPGGTNDVIPMTPTPPKSENQKLNDSGMKWNSNLQLYETPNGTSGSQMSIDNVDNKPRYSVFPPGISRWSTDQSGVRRYDNIDDALASINEPATPGASAPPLTPDDLNTVPAPASFTPSSNITNDFVEYPVGSGDVYMLTPFNGGERYQLTPQNPTAGEPIQNPYLDELNPDEVAKIDTSGSGGGGVPKNTPPSGSQYEEASVRAEGLRNTGIFDDWYGREAELADGKLWLSKEKFNADVDKGKYGSVSDGQREALRQALMNQAAQVNAVNEADLSTQSADFMNTQRAKAVPFDQAKKNSIVMINENGVETPFKVEGKRNGKLYGHTMTPDTAGEVYYDDGLSPNEAWGASDIGFGSDEETADDLKDYGPYAFKDGGGNVLPPISPEMQAKADKLMGPKPAAAPSAPGGGGGGREWPPLPSSPDDDDAIALMDEAIDAFITDWAREHNGEEVDNMGASDIEDALFDGAIESGLDAEALDSMTAWDPHEYYDRWRNITNDGTEVPGEGHVPVSEREPLAPVPSAPVGVSTPSAKSGPAQPGGGKRTPDEVQKIADFIGASPATTADLQEFYGTNDPQRRAQLGNKLSKQVGPGAWADINDPEYVDSVVLKNKPIKFVGTPDAASDPVESRGGFDLWDNGAEGWAVYSSDGDLVVADTTEANARSVFNTSAGKDGGGTPAYAPLDKARVDAIIDHIGAKGKIAADLREFFSTTDPKRKAALGTSLDQRVGPGIWSDINDPDYVDNTILKGKGTSFADVGNAVAKGGTGGTFKPENYNKMKAGDADTYLAGLTPENRAAAMDFTKKDVPARAKKFDDASLRATYEAATDPDVKRDLKIELARRGLLTEVDTVGGGEGAAPAAEAPAVPLSEAPAAPAPAAPAAPAMRSRAAIQTELDDVTAQLDKKWGDQFGNMGPGAQNMRNNLMNRRKALYAERDAVDAKETDDLRTSLKTVQPHTYIKPQHDYVRQQWEMYFAEEDSMYSPTDTTITALLRDAIKKHPNDPYVTIGPPSEAEVQFPMADARILAYTNPTMEYSPPPGLPAIV
jgi:Arc/MetJ-type ribon-helix-helix transcriptional regulator